MKALSLTQPWATAIARGVKTVETRSWSTRFRGQIAIHASKGFPADARDFASVEHTLGRLPSSVPLGAIIAVATIVNVVQTEEIESQVDEIERLYGDFSRGRFGWILEDVIALPKPIPCRGALSLWDVPEEVERQIREQL